jgi:ribonuclease P protein component
MQQLGKRVSCPHFVLLVAPRPEAKGEDREGSPSRLGLVVTKKVGNAVARNRIKRVCRDCFRTWGDLLPPGIDLIVIAKEGADSLGASEVRAEWARVAETLRKKALDASKAVARAQKTTHGSTRRGTKGPHSEPDPEGRPG